MVESLKIVSKARVRVRKIGFRPFTLFGKLIADSGWLRG
jgi:hypothetical protein